MGTKDIYSYPPIGLDIYISYHIPPNYAAWLHKNYEIKINGSHKMSGFVMPFIYDLLPNLGGILNKDFRDFLGLENKILKENLF